MDNFIEIYENTVTKDVCEYFVDFFEKEDKLGKTHQGKMGRGNYRKEWKDCTDLTVRHCDADILESYEKSVDEKFHEYFKKYHVGFGELGGNPDGIIAKYDFESCEDLHQGPLMHRYEPPNQGYHIWHADWSPWRQSGAKRILVGMLYLNDVEVGGETEFFYQEEKIKPKQGNLVVWPSYFTHLHRGSPPISNTKYIVNKWGILKRK